MTMQRKSLSCRIGYVGSLLVCVLLWGCGDGDNSTNSLFEEGDRRSVLIVVDAPEGHASAVTIDSVQWLPTAVFPAPGQMLEIVGDYVIAFRNDSESVFELRDDLRFFDNDDFLVDNFIPFDLPLRLPAKSTTWQRGEFVLRGEPDAARFGLRTLRIAVSLVEVSASDG